ncbi:cell division protein FtsW [Candidatus Microgenomates bacterium]|nr:cell division protein FtsW [Candidatus Microgenomates bacterium]
MDRAASPLMRRKHRPDYLLVISVGMLVLLGLVVLYSISPILSHKLLGDVSRNHFLYGQLVHIGVGLIGYFIGSQLHYSQWQKLLPFLIVISGLSVLLLMIPGVGITKNGATRWVGIGPFSYQPSEIIKFTLVILLASRFSQAVSDSFTKARQNLGLAMAVLLILAGAVLLLQRDLGTMVVMAMMVVGIFFSSGAALKQVGVLLGTGLGLGILSIILFPHRIARVVTFLKPEDTAASGGYHLNQALIAIGSGGLLGLGLGKSIQVYGYLPEAANDSIFAIVGETFGFIGSLGVIGLFGLLIYRGLRIGLNAPNRYAQLIVIGVIIWLGTQTAINMAAMLGLVPLTGIPLPFLSYGGTSLVMSMTAIGVVVNISKYTQRGLYADSSFRRGNGRTYHTYPSRSQGA